MELFHLAAATGLLTVVLWLVFLRNDELAPVREDLPAWGVAVAAFLISFLGFALHELGHKFTAQHFGHWSEFRASWLGLAAALAIAWVWALPVALPGATWHTGQGRSDQGRISAMGPLVNCAIAVVALPFTFGFLDTAPEKLAAIVVFFSGALAVFNLLPLGPLDGRKVLAWNPLVWIVLVALGVAIAFQGGRAVGFF